MCTFTEVTRPRGQYLYPESGMAFDIEDLYRTTYDSVVRFLYRRVWDADRAEDLAQEVFMRALAHQPEKPRSWVFAVAANNARDEARVVVGLEDLCPPRLPPLAERLDERRRDG